jgi:hypothetical protein
MIPTDRFLFDAKLIDDAWLAEFFRRVEAGARWLDECDIVVAQRYATDPRARDGFSRVAYGLLRTGRTAEAVVWYEKDQAAQRMGRWQFLRQLDALLALERVSEAEARVDSYYRDHPEARDGWATIAAHWQHQNDTGRFREFLRRDHAAQRLSPFWLLRLAEAEARADDWIKATALIEEAYRLDSGLLDGFGRLANVHYDAGREVAGDEMLRRDQQLKRLSPAPRLRLATYLARIGELASAIELVAEAYRDDASLRDGFARLGHAQLQAEEWTAADELYARDQAAGRLQPGPLLEWAHAKARLGDYAGATALVEESYAAWGGGRDGFSSLARIALDQEQPDRAREFFARDQAVHRMSLRRRQEYAVLQACVVPAEAEALADEVYASDLVVRNVRARVGVAAAASGAVSSALPFFVRDFHAGRLTTGWTVRALELWGEDYSDRSLIGRWVLALARWLPDELVQPVAERIFGGRAEMDHAEKFVASLLVRDGRLWLRGAELEFADLAALTADLEEIFVAERAAFESSNPRPRIIDTWAGTGLAACYFYAMHPLATLMVIESDPRLSAILRRNLERNRWNDRVQWLGPDARWDVLLDKPADRVRIASAAQGENRAALERRGFVIEPPPSPESRWCWAVRRS